jgi:hypothetical protein
MTMTHWGSLGGVKGESLGQTQKKKKSRGFFLNLPDNRSGLNDTWVKIMINKSVYQWKGYGPRLTLKERWK